MNEKTIYFDDVISELQRFGGISVYWKNVSKPVLDAVVNRGVQGKAVLSTIGMERLLKFIPIWSNADVYHSSYQRPILFKGKTKVVVTVHDCMYELYGTGLRRKLHIWYTRWALSQADYIICVSECTKLDMEKLYPDVIDKPRGVIHNGFDAEIELIPIKTSEEPFLLYVGNRGHCKNFENQIRLVANQLKEKNWQLFVVGGGDFTASENQFLQSLNLLDRTRHFRGLSDGELRFLMAQAKALLFMSLYEGFGIPIIEAFSLGCPVIASNRSAIPEITGSEYAGLFELDDETGVTSFLASLDDKVWKEQLVRYMKLRATKFKWDYAKDSHEKIYKYLLC